MYKDLEIYIITNHLILREIFALFVGIVLRSDTMLCCHLLCETKQPVMRFLKWEKYQLFSCIPLCILDITATYDAKMSHFSNLWISRIRWRIDDVNPAAAQTRQNQTVTAFALVAIATGACVPSGVVNLVPNMRHVTATYHLGRKKT